MTAPTSTQLRVDRLPRDTFRSILAGLITALTIGGWIDALGKTRMRGALAAQTTLWWIEQIVGVALAIVCIGIIMRKRSFLWPAFWLTVYSLIFDIVRWYFEFRERQILIVGPVENVENPARGLGRRRRRRSYDHRLERVVVAVRWYRS